MPFRNFNYYHPSQRGSASIKAVLPALTSRSYAELGIHNGDQASTAFFKVNYGKATEDERRQVRADLEKYCGLDTEGMVWIVDRLAALVSP